MNEIRVGTCSWKYPSWSGLVYSGPEADFLREYAEHFNCVEIDQWFWSLFGKGAPRLPKPADVANYRRAVPDDFRFAIKAPNSITLTHSYKKAKSDPLVGNPHFLTVDLFARFLERIEALHDVLGPILFQFEYLNRQKMASRDTFLEQFAAFANRLPDGFLYGLEIRNPKWLDARFFDALQAMSVVPVLISGYWMPFLEDLYAAHSNALRQFPAVVLRLMGNARGGIEKTPSKVWNKVVDPHDAELDAVSRIILDLRAAGPQPFLFINNHYEGSAPLTIERIRERLGIGS